MSLRRKTASVHFHNQHSPEACDITLFRKRYPCVACDIISGYSKSLHIKRFSGFWRKTALFQSYDFKSTPPSPSLKYHFSLPEGAYIMSRLEISHAQ